MPSSNGALGEKPKASTEALGDQIAELAAHIDAATYRMLELLREFDERNGWSYGCRSCAHWLSWRTGLNLGASREKVRVARALGTLPVISEELRLGKLSYSKVRALTRVATPETEEELLIFARHGTVSHVEKVVRAWRRVDRLEELAEVNERHLHRSARAFFDEDGMFVLRARLDPEVGAVVMRALEAAMDQLYVQRPRPSELEDGAEVIADIETSYEQRLCDALSLVAESALGDGLGSGAKGDRYQVVVHVDDGVLEEAGEGVHSALEDGIRVSAETSRRIACDASSVVMKHAPDGSVLDVGRKTRTIPPAIRRAIEHRDGGCRFPGCGMKVCDAHHVQHWADGGETRLGNLVLLCRRHHRAVHEEGYEVELLADGQARFRRPDRRLFPQVPSPPWLPGNPVESLQWQHEEAGLEIDRETNFPLWNGDALDLGYAVDALRGWAVSRSALADSAPQ